MPPSQQEKIFLNGKAQVIELLRLMAPAEKDHLIKSIRLKDPSLAGELSEKGASFKDLRRLNDDDLSTLISHINPQIMGLALKEAPLAFQRRALCQARRPYAEEAFQILTTTYATEKRDSQRAQDKVLAVLSRLTKSGVIKLN